MDLEHKYIQTDVAFYFASNSLRYGYTTNVLREMDSLLNYVAENLQRKCGCGCVVESFLVVRFTAGKADIFRNLRTRSQRSHEELHLVDKVSSLHLAPVDLLVRPPEVAPLGVLDGVALRQLFGLAAGELDQDFAPALWAVTH